ncbi:MAG: alpha/beta hydrolase [Bacilli bacterium]|nr:alpha/beta hydrolase [Bacilli bacterium]
MFSYDGIKINYEYINNKSKNTLVFLHGWGQNVEMMKPIADPFNKTCNILIVDLPGHGKSEEPKKVFSLYDFADMVHELVLQLKIKNPVLIGHSFGGKISMIYASKYDVKKLILLSSPYKVEIKKQPLKVKLMKKLAKVPGFKGLANYFKKKMGSTDYRNASPMMRDILVAHVNTDITEDVKKISVPTIIIWGTNDLTVSIDNAYEIEKLIKDSAVIPYEGLSHFAYLENKNQTISIIDSFIK